MDTKWQTIETAPKDGSPILMFGKYAHVGLFAVVEWRRENWKVETEDGLWGVDFHPTHWVPLPPPPGETA